MEDFATLLIAARERLGITQAQLATSAGLTPSYLSLIENRKKPPPSDSVCERLAGVLGIPSRELLEVAHLQRSPTTVQRRVNTLNGKLSRERRARGLVLEWLLSPFLSMATPGAFEFDWLPGSSGRNHRLREVLAVLGRRHQDRAKALSRLVDELPERDRRLLLEALPRILGRRDGREPGAPPELFYSLPAPELSPKRPFLLAWAGPPSGGEMREGDLLLVDPTLRAQAGDIVLFRGPDGGAVARRLQGAGAEYRLAPVEQAAGPAEEAADAVAEARKQVARDGVGVVVEIRRPLRRTPA